MWKKYKVSIDKFIAYSKDDFFQVNIVPFVVDKRLIVEMKADQDEKLRDLFKAVYSKHLDMDDQERLMSIEPLKQYYTVYELMVLITFLEKHKVYEWSGERVKINYALHWKNKTFLEAGCIVIGREYPIIYNFYSTPVVEDILEYLYDKGK